MTTITTATLKTYSRVHNYLYNKNIECWGDLEKLQISFFGLNREETDALLKKLLTHFPLAPATPATLPAQPALPEQPSMPEQPILAA